MPIFHFLHLSPQLLRQPPQGFCRLGLAERGGHHQGLEHPVEPVEDQGEQVRTEETGIQSGQIFCFT